MSQYLESTALKTKDVFKQLQKQKTNHTKMSLIFSMNDGGKSSIVTHL